LTDLAPRIADVRDRIAAAARRAGREIAEVTLVAVSKSFGAERVAELSALGVRDFGENRLQEALQKIPQVQLLTDAELEWHMIGGLQRNKAAAAARLFAWIHSVDRPVLALELERGAAQRTLPLRVLAQVNVDAEPQKGGVPPAGLAELVACIDACPHLALVGLMAIPRACADPEEVRPSFARLRALLDETNRTRAPEARLAHLSMGMSGDFEVAIEEGATLVRVGTAIFGERSA
jgi:pyridoxal phosphate enzyme (YggS family)